MDFSKMDRSQLTVAASGFSVILSLHFTSQLLSQHMFYWKNPKEQKSILFIIMIAPVYAINSFAGLLDIKGSIPVFMILNFVKECYQAWAIANFLALMYSYLKISITKNDVPDEIKGREIHHSFPMTLFQSKKTHLNRNTLGLLYNWTWQFVVIRPICSILMITLQILGVYPDWLSWTFTAILSLSSFLAIYSLVVFYHVFAKELEPHKPLSKFICIIGIIFFCFWQGVFVDILVKMGILRPHHYWLETEHVEQSIQNVLICVEMIIFSVLQQYAYHVSPYSGDIEAKLRMQRKDD